MAPFDPLARGPRPINPEIEGAPPDQRRSLLTGFTPEESDPATAMRSVAPLATVPLATGALPQLGVGAGLVNTLDAATPRTVERPIKAAAEPGFDPLALAGLMGGRPAAGGSGSASVQIREGRPVDEEYLRAKRATEEGYREDAGDLEAQRKNVYQQHDEFLKQYALDAKEAKQRYQGVSDETLSDYRATVADLKRARDELRDMNVDTGRFWNTMPTAQKVLLAFGNMLGEAGETASGGKVVNEVGRWMAKAVDRDIEDQREAIKRKMDEVNMTAKERDTLWRQWSESEQQIRAASKAAYEMELGRLNLATDDVRLKAEFSKAIRDSRQGEAEAAHGEKVASQDQVTRTKSYSSGGGGGAAAGGGAESEKLQFLQLARRHLGEMKSLVDANGGKVPVIGADAVKYEKLRKEAGEYKALALGLKRPGQMKEMSESMPHSPGIMEWIGKKALGAVGLRDPNAGAEQLAREDRDLKAQQLASLGLPSAAADLPDSQLAQLLVAARAAKAGKGKGKSKGKR